MECGQPLKLFEGGRASNHSQSPTIRRNGGASRPLHEHASLLRSAGRNATGAAGMLLSRYASLSDPLHR